MKQTEMKKLAEWAVGSALSEGAETVEVTLSDRREIEVSARKGSVENLTDSASSSIAISVSVDSRKAIVTSSDLEENSISSLIRDGIDIARFMGKDEFFGLPDENDLGVTSSPLGIFSRDIEAVEADSMIETALHLEKIACDMDQRIISDGAWVSHALERVVFSNSMGFCEGFGKTYSSIGLSCAAEEESRRGENIGKKQSSYWFSQATSPAHLESIEHVARKAVERTIRKLGAVRPKTCEVPVVFDPVTARALLSHLSAAVSGGQIYKKASFLVDRKGDEIGSPHVTIYDDPLLEGRIGSRPFDSEGVRSRTNIVFDRGRLETYLMNSYQARKLGERTTGNAGGPSNFYLKPGSASQEEIISSVDDGLYLTYLIGPGVNTVTGDFSQGAHGIWIEKGELSHPVDEFTVTGTFQKMLLGLSAVASDIDWNSSVAAPTIKIDSLTISGT
jgi:PmbA protein